MTYCQKSSYFLWIMFNFNHSWKLMNKLFNETKLNKFEDSQVETKWPLEFFWNWTHILIRILRFKKIWYKKKYKNWLLKLNYLMISNRIKVDFFNIIYFYIIKNYKVRIKKKFIFENKTHKTKKILKIIS